MSIETESDHKEDPEISVFIAVCTYYSYAILVLFGHVRDYFGKLFGRSRYIQSKPRTGYSVLLKSWESFYTRRLYHRIQDCWNRPICSSPGARIEVMERVSENNNYTLGTSGKSTTCINVGSYNYLGYADDWTTTCSKEVMGSLKNWPASMCSSRMDFGSTTLLTGALFFVAQGGV